MADPDNLERFVKAQDPIYAQVCAELRAGCKHGHWMWFVFPQIDGLGHSAMSKEFAISSLDEAKKYLEHPILGRRLIECAQLVSSVGDRTAIQIFGYPDNLKLWSSMTLFSRAAPDARLFQDVLARYFDGMPDQRTLELLEAM